MQISGQEITFIREGKCIDCGSYATVYHGSTATWRSCTCSRQVFAVTDNNGKIILSQAAEKQSPLGTITIDERLFPIGTAKDRAIALNLL